MYFATEVVTITRLVVIALLVLPPLRGQAQPAVPTASTAASTEPNASQAAPPTSTVPRHPDDLIDRSDSITAAPAQARGWERRPDEPGPGLVGWFGRGLGLLAYPVALATLMPAKGVIYLESHYGTLSKIKAFFYNEAGTAGVLPTGSFQSGTGLMLGAKAFHKDVFGHDEEVALRAAYGFSVGREAQLKFELPHLMGNRLYLEGRLRYERRNNLLFAGIGNSAVAGGSNLDPRAASTETRYAEARWLGLLAGGVELHPGGTMLRLGGAAIFNHRNFDGTVAPSLGTSLGDVYDTSELVGFDDGFNLLELTADAAFDSRPNDGPDSAGFAAEAFAGAPVTSDYSYFHYGVEAHGYIQPWRPRRLIVLRMAHEAVRGASDSVPFSELPRLGGAGLLRGYARDTFRDKLATIATVEYHYPIHENLSGQFFLESGKVARSYGELSADKLFDDWNFGYGGGLLVHTKSGIKVRTDIAWGDGLRFYIATDVLEAFHRRGREL